MYSHISFSPVFRYSFFLNENFILGAFIVDAVDYLDRSREIARKEIGQKIDILQTKLVLTADSLDPVFISMMFRYVDVALILQPSVGGAEFTSAKGSNSNNFSYGSNNFSYTVDVGNNTENGKTIKMILKHKLSPSGMEYKVVFSSITFKNERLLCAI